MGSYVSTAKFFQLPFRSLRYKNSFALTASDDKIIHTLASSSINHIQTTKEPTNKELRILNEIFRMNPGITFRYYGMLGKYADISYLEKIPNLRSLCLDIYCKIENIEIIEKLDLDHLALSCYSLNDYSFLRNASRTIRSLSIDLEDKTYKMDINDILHMSGLESLAIRNVKKGLDKLSEFKELKDLYLRAVPIKDYSFLEDMGVRKIYLSFQNVAYFNTFGVVESIEEVSLWRNSNLTDLSFLLRFPNLKRIIISDQKKIDTIPDLTGLANLEEIYFLDSDAETVKKYCNPNVKVYTQYNPVDIS